jgi:fructose-bisphosphate aldolase class 1
VSQEATIVLIGEPEVLMDDAHSSERCEEQTSTTLVSVFEQLHALQDEALKAWDGKAESFAAAQAFARHAEFNGLAPTVAYTSKHEREAA